MPELPEVEILVRYLAAELPGAVIRRVRVLVPKVLRDSERAVFERRFRASRITAVTRRAKYILVDCEQSGTADQDRLIAHLGMTGRMYLRNAQADVPRHAVAVWDLEDGRQWVFADSRRFGQLVVGGSALTRLGPEPLAPGFEPGRLVNAFQRTQRCIKAVLLDQSVIAGLGNIYAGEALYDAGIDPRRLAQSLDSGEVRRLCRSVRRVLRRALKLGSGLDLDFAGTVKPDGLFYFGSSGVGQPTHERFQVYDRCGERCQRCGERIQRVVQAARSTYFCVGCQK